MLTNGLDGVMTIAARARERIAKAGARLGVSRALKPHAAKHRLALPPHEIILEVERAFVGFDDAADGIVAHRRDRVRDAETVRRAAP